MVQVQNVSKLFRLHGTPLDRLCHVAGIRTGAEAREFWALRDVSFRIDKGEVFGLIGPNGSGKSTLLQIAAHTLEPTTGRVLVQGRVSALLELGAGFNPEFTGRENVVMSLELSGALPADIETTLPRVLEFAGIGEHIDRPVREYSSGMYVRLAFSTAIHSWPDVLIVDEALAVGDAIFAARCISKLNELKNSGMTIVLVSHDLGLVKHLCDRAALLIRGRVAFLGSPAEAANRYIAYAQGGESDPEITEALETSRHGDGTARIRSVEVRQSGQLATVIQAGTEFTIHIDAELLEDAVDPVVGILIRNRNGIEVYGTNTRVEEVHTGTYEAGARLVTEFNIQCALNRHDYTVTAAIQSWEGATKDWVDDVAHFFVVNRPDLAGIVHLPTRVTYSAIPA